MQTWLSLFIHDCIDCQMHKYKNMKQTKLQPYHSQNGEPFITLLLQWILKVHYSLLSKQVFTFMYFLINLAFTNSRKKCPLRCKFLFRHWISKFGTPQFLMTDTETEDIDEVLYSV